MRAMLMLLVLAGFAAGCAEPATVARSDAELRALAAKGTPVIDVRSPREYAAKHLSMSTNLPVDEVQQRISRVAPDKNRPVLVHCQSGGRSASARQTLEQMGYKQVIDLGSFANARKVLEPAAIP